MKDPSKYNQALTPVRHECNECQTTIYSLQSSHAASQRIFRPDFFFFTDKHALLTSDYLSELNSNKKKNEKELKYDKIAWLNAKAY